MTQPLISQKNPPGIARLPAALAGFCCEDLNCPECLRVYRKGLALRSKSVSQRKPTLASALRQAKKAGKNVKGAEIYRDRVVLQFGEPEPTEASNPWLTNLPKATKQ